MAGAASVLAACGGHAATTTATPETIDRVLAAARAGDTIVLAAGDYAPIRLRNQKWTAPVIVEAKAARLTAVGLRNVSNLTWRGGVFNGGDVERSGLGMENSDHIVVDGTAMSHFTRNGIGMGRSSDIRVVGNTFSNMGSDGIDVAMSRRVVVDGNSCLDFLPTVKAHPDCVQLWSRPSDPPVADVTITNTTAIGEMQGITMFNHVRPDKEGKQVDDGGFDRITVTDNKLRIGQYHAITMQDCRNCVARNNVIETLPDRKNPRARAWLKFNRSTVAACGNKVESFPDAPGTARCSD